MSSSSACNTESERGVLYIAFSKPFIAEALISAESVKRHNPEIPIAMFSDEVVSSPFVDIFREISPKHIRAKVDFIDESPFAETLFLDSDTIVVSDLVEVFELLQRFDLALSHDLARKRENISDLIPEYRAIPYSFSELNPGVMVFKKNQNVQSFFRTWRELFYTYKDVWAFEQPTFRVALWNSDVDFYVLPPEFNVRGKKTIQKVMKNKERLGEGHLEPRIFHMHTDNSILKGKFRTASLEKAEKICRKNALPIT